MNIDCEKPKTIYKYKAKDGKEYYSLGLSKKKQDGSWESGFISCRFKRDAKIENKTRILIKEGWVDFYVKDRITYPFIFINLYEEVEEPRPEGVKTIEEVNEFSTMNIKTEYQETPEVVLEDKDLPF